MKVWRGDGKFLEFLKADPEVTLSEAELAELFDLGYHFKHVDRIFGRVFGDESAARAAAQ
jgi:adenylosuccinate lyase